MTLRSNVDGDRACPSRPHRALPGVTLVIGAVPCSGTVPLRKVRMRSTERAPVPAPPPTGPGARCACDLPQQGAQSLSQSSRGPSSIWGLGLTRECSFPVAAVRNYYRVT